MDEEVEESCPSDETLTRFVFGEEGLPKDVSRDEYMEYISSLCSSGVNHLNHEPQKLASEKASVLEKTQELAFNNYGSFIKTSDCVKNIAKEFNVIEDKLDGLIDKIPSLVNKTATFSEEAKCISKRWREASLVLSKHSQLLEFLEIPQMMDTCLRNNCYEEALQLYAYVQNLKERHGDSISLVATVARDTGVTKQIMVSQLLSELHSSIQLPACLKVIGYLRKLDIFTETELRIKFLAARDSWLQSLIKGIATNSPLVHVTKLIEVNRVNLFDIVTQYRAVFADEEPITSSTMRYYNIMVSNAAQGDRDFNDSTILTSWLSYKIDQFLATLRSDLNQCIENEVGSYYSVESVVDPCFYFGLSMSRIGADIRPQLVTIFNAVILKRFVNVIKKGTTMFEKTLENFTLSVDQTNANKSLGEVTLENEPNKKEGSLEAPGSVAVFPPLGHYLNHLLMGFNEMRPMVPLAIVTRLRDALNESLSRASLAIYRYYKAEESGLSLGERDLLTQFVDQYVNYLVPHIQRCFNSLCPTQLLAKLLGISVLEFNKLKSQDEAFSFSDIGEEGLTEDLKELLPQKQEPIEAEDDGGGTGGEGKERGGVTIGVSADHETRREEVVREGVE